MSNLDYSKLDSENSTDCILVEDLLSDTDESEPGSLMTVPVCIDGDNRVWAKAGVFSPQGEVISKNVSECFPSEINPAFHSTYENDSTTVEEVEVSDIDEQDERDALDVTFLGSNSVITVKAAAPPVSSGDGVFQCRNFPGNEIFSDTQESGLKHRNVKKGNNCSKVYEDFSCNIGRLPKVREKTKGMPKKLSNLNDVSDSSYSLIKSDKIPNKHQNSTEGKSCNLSKHSDESDTDTEEMAFMQDEFRSWMNGASNCISENKNTGNNSEFEIFSDDECSSNKAHRMMKNASGKNIASNDHGMATDEEDIDTLLPSQNKISKNHSKEFTEYDESGGIKQVTKVKTETSVKVVEGDADQGDGDDVMSSTTTRTTTRIITTVTTQGGEQEVTEQQEDGSGGDLRSSMEAVLTQFMSGDASNDQTLETRHDD